MKSKNMVRQSSKWTIVVVFGALWLVSITWISIAFYNTLSKEKLNLPFENEWLWMILISSVAFLIGSIGAFGLKKFRWSGNYQLFWWIAFFLHAVLIDIYLIHKLVHKRAEFSIILTSSVLIIINLMMIFEHRFKYYLKNWNQEEYRDNLKNELDLEIKIVKNLLIYARLLKQSHLDNPFNSFHVQVLVGLLNAKSFDEIFPQKLEINKELSSEPKTNCFETLQKFGQELEKTLLFVAFAFRMRKMRHYRFNNNWKEWDNHYQVNLEKCRKIRNFFKLIVCRPNEIDLVKFWEWTHLIESNIYSNLPVKPQQL